MKLNKIIVGNIIQTNCYVLSNELTGECIIIDPGDEADRIRAYIEAEKLKPSAILLTHGHFDHIMAAEKLREYYKIRIYALKGEENLLKDVSLNMSNVFTDAFTLCADIYLNDSDVINEAGFEIKVIASAGHTSGSCSYYISSEKSVFTGDTIFCCSIGRTDFPTGDSREIIKSGKRILQLPAETVIYSGHGPDSTVQYERKSNPYLA